MHDTLLINLALLDTGAGRLRAGQCVRIRGGLIVEVGEGLAGAGARVVDLGGRTLMPGLIDCHVHICSDSMTATPAIFPALQAARSGRILRETLMRGFTTVRDAGGADFGYVQAVEDGLFEGPRLFVSGRPISQTGGHIDLRNPADPWPSCSCSEASTLRVVADGVDAVRRACREELRRGAHAIKIMASGGISSPADPIDHVQFSTAEIEAAVDEATRAKRYVLAHAYTDEAIARAVTAGVRSIEHGNFIEDDTARLMAARGAFLVPTLVVYRRIVAHGREVGVSELHLEKAREVLATGTRSLEIAHRAGVKMAFGTDLFRAPKQYQAEELLIRAEVLPAADVLRSATLTSAELLGMAGRLGRVAPGHFADVLAVDGDPLADLGLLQEQGRHIALIMKGGVIHKSHVAGLEAAPTSR
jgi:imidazolonepropionase-like amidohydrolase